MEDDCFRSSYVRERSVLARIRVQGVIHRDWTGLCKVFIGAMCITLLGGAAVRPMFTTILVVSTLSFIAFRSLSGSLSPNQKQRKEKMKTPWYGKTRFWLAIISAVAFATVYIRKRWLAGKM